MPGQWEALIATERRRQARILSWLLGLFGGMAVALLGLVILQTIFPGDPGQERMIGTSWSDLTSLFGGLLGLGAAWVAVRRGCLACSAHLLFVTIIGSVVIDGLANGVRDNGLILVLFLPIAGANLLLRPGWSFRYAVLCGAAYLGLFFLGPHGVFVEPIDLLMHAAYFSCVYGGVAILTFQAARSQERQLAASLRDAAAIERERAALETRVGERTADLAAALAEQEAQAAQLRQAEGALRQSEEHFRALIEHSADVVMVITIDGTIRYQSPASERVLGYSTGTMVGTNLLPFVHEADLPGIITALARDHVPNEVVALTCRLRHRNGGYRTLDITATDLQHQPSVAGIVINARDITERERSERQRAVFFALGEQLGAATTARAATRIILSAADELLPWDASYLSLYSAEHDTLYPVLNYDVVNGQRTEVPSATGDGFAPGPTSRRTFAEGGQLILRNEEPTDGDDLLTFGDTGHRSAALIFVPIRSATSIVGLLSLQSYTPNAYTQEDLIVAQALAGHCAAALERARAEEALAHQAFHDPLTGLPNRASFHRWEEESIALGSAAPTILFLDLDGFKHVNDSLGHDVGDHLLVEVAARLRATVRPTDRVARFGGDEFVVWLDASAALTTAEAIAARLLDALRAPFTLRGHDLIVSASIGIGHGAAGDSGAQEGLRQADIALYQAKGRGKANFASFEPGMDGTALERLTLEHDLRLALERQEFALHYQPTVSLANGRVSGVEALIRWQHPRLGLVPPSQFIPLAEETGVILPLGRWLIKEACRQARAWQAFAPATVPGTVPLVMSVNLSAVQLRQPDLVAQIAQILEETGLHPDALQLEITEGVAMSDVEAMRATLRSLKALGVRLAIDDFGTGYSSLAYLQRFSVDVLKIDRIFVDRLGIDDENDAIVWATISLAQALRLNVIAEGVETLQQSAILHSLGCEYGQGFLFARPGEAAAIAALLAERAGVVLGV